MPEGSNKGLHRPAIANPAQRLEGGDTHLMAGILERGDEWLDRARVADLPQRFGGRPAMGQAAMFEELEERRYSLWGADLPQRCHGGYAHHLNWVLEGDEKQLYRAPVPNLAQRHGCCPARLRIPRIAQRIDQLLHLVLDLRWFSVELATQLLWR